MSDAHQTLPTEDQVVLLCRRGAVRLMAPVVTMTSVHQKRSGEGEHT